MHFLLLMSYELAYPPDDFDFTDATTSITTETDTANTAANYERLLNSYLPTAYCLQPTC